jgi:hypothetical protein
MDNKSLEFMKKYKELPKTERRNAVKNLSKEQKGQFNEMNKKYGAYLKGLNKGGKVKFSRGGGVATQGTKFSRNG